MGGSIRDRTDRFDPAPQEQGHLQFKNCSASVGVDVITKASLVKLAIASSQGVTATWSGPQSADANRTCMVVKLFLLRPYYDRLHMLVTYV